MWTQWKHWEKGQNRAGSPAQAMGALTWVPGSRPYLRDIYVVHVKQPLQISPLLILLTGWPCLELYTGKQIYRETTTSKLLVLLQANTLGVFKGQCQRRLHFLPFQKLVQRKGTKCECVYHQVVSKLHKVLSKASVISASFCCSWWRCLQLNSSPLSLQSMLINRHFRGILHQPYFRSLL